MVINSLTDEVPLNNTRLIVTANRALEARNEVGGAGQICASSVKSQIRAICMEYNVYEAVGFVQWPCINGESVSFWSVQQ